MFPFRQPAALADSFPPCLLRSSARSPPSPSSPLSLALANRGPASLQQPCLAFLLSCAVGPYLSSPHLLTNNFSLMTIMNKADGCCYLLKEVRGLHTTVVQYLYVTRKRNMSAQLIQIGCKIRLFIIISEKPAATSCTILFLLLRLRP